MAVTEDKLHQYFNPEYIYKYLSLIQEKIIASPETPSPMAILRKLLVHYQHGFFPVFNNTPFFISPFRKHTKFSQELQNNLDRADFDLMQQLDQYLKDHELNKKGAFFSLLISWSYYYKGLLEDLSHYVNLKRQILIPLKILKEEKLASEIDFCIERLQSDNPDIIVAACTALERIPISAPSKKQEVINKLLAMTDKMTVVKSPDGLRHYEYFRYAFKALSSIPISNDMCEEVVDILLVRSAAGYQCNELFLLLKNIPIPDSRMNAVMDYLYEKINDDHWEIRQAAWDVIQHYDGELTRKIKWIDSILFQIQQVMSVNYSYSEYRSDQDKRQETGKLILRLATCPIPDEQKEIIINLAFTIIKDLANISQGENACGWLARNACLVIRSCAPLPDTAFNEYVVDRLLSMLENNPSTVYEGYDALSKLRIPGKYLERILHLLLAGLEREDLAYTNRLECMRNIPFPVELKNQLVDKLILVIKDNNRELQMGSYGTLVELGIPKNELVNIVLLLLDRLTDKSRNCWEANYILQTLPEIDIPPEMKQTVQKTLLTYALEQIKDTNFLLDSCVALGKIKFFPENSFLITKELINVLMRGEVHSDRIDGVLECIHDLAKNLDVSNIIRIQIMLDHIRSTSNSPFIIMSLSPFHHLLDQLRAQKESLESTPLAPEIILHIARFL